MKKEAIMEQEEFNKRHGLKPEKQKRRKSVYIERPEVEDDDDDDAPSEPKKQKVSDTNGNESIGNGKGDGATPSPAKKVTKKATKQKKPQIKLPKKTPPKPRKKKADAKPAKNTETVATNDTSAVNGDVEEETQNETQIETEAETHNESQMETDTERTRQNSQSELSEANDRIESEAAGSSTDTSTKKKPKKQKKSSKIEPPGDKPPSSVFEYFARFIHTGKPRKAQKAFDRLTKMEEKRIRIDYNELVETYVTKLKKYLASLPKEEAVAYVSEFLNFIFEIHSFPAFPINFFSSSFIQIEKVKDSKGTSEATVDNGSQEY